MTLVDLDSLDFENADTPPDSFLNLRTQQGQINWLAVAMAAINALSIVNADEYLKIVDAVSTYLPIEDAENTYTTLDEFYFTEGETVTYTGSTISGFITSGLGLVRFYLPLHKRTDKVTSVTINSLIGGIRVVGGGYLNSLTDSTNWVNQDIVLSTSFLPMGLNLVMTGTFTNTTNNTPLSMYLSRCSLTFN